MIEIIPAIDLINGKCIRLSRGEFSTKKIYSDNPAEVAKKYEDAGIKNLHVVDLDGAKAKKIVNWDVIEKITNSTSLKMDFGGGIRSEKDISDLFDIGVAQIIAGSIAVSNPDVVIGWIKRFGPDRIILGADIQNNKIAVNAWKNLTNVDLFSFLEKFIENGLHRTIVTDISKDGLLSGPSFDIYKKLRKKFGLLKITASGGISSVEDIYALNDLNIDGAIIGKAIYEGKIKLNDLKEFLC